MTKIPEVPSVTTDALFIGGEWVAPRGGQMVEVVDATTEQPFIEVAIGDAGELDQAISAARLAFDSGPWPRMPAAERADYLRRIAQEWRRRSEDVEAVFPREVGALRTTAEQFVERAAREYEIYADLAAEFEFERRMKPSSGGDVGLLAFEPVGVVGAIVPWNAPVSSIAHKVGPALASGCTVVLRVSREAPVEGFITAEIAATVGLPPGVLNVVVTDRPSSEVLIKDPRIDKIAFTGSTASGQHIASLAGSRMARMTLELGGKSPALILEDADIEEAVSTITAGQCRLTGQVCASLTRLVVHQSVFSEFSGALVEAYRGVTVGNPFDPSSDIGPLSSAQHRESVEGYIKSGIEEGAELLVGGARPDGIAAGFYLEPALFLAPDTSLTIAQEEIFGPVTTMLVARDEAHAIEIANDTVYGLNASVFTKDADRAYSIARRLRSGTVGHNAQRSDFAIAFGGVKQSGVGREGGEEGLRAYLEPKTIILSH